MFASVGRKPSFGYVTANTNKYGVVIITADTQEEAVKAREKLAKGDLFLTPTFATKMIKPLTLNLTGLDVGDTTKGKPNAFQFSFGYNPKLTEKQLHAKLKKQLGKKLVIED